MCVTSSQDSADRKAQIEAAENWLESQGIDDNNEEIVNFPDSAQYSQVTEAWHEVRGLDPSKREVTFLDAFVHENADGNATVTGSQYVSKLLSMQQEKNSAKNVYFVETPVPSHRAPPELPTAEQQKMRGLDLSKQEVSMQDDFVNEKEDGKATVFTGSEVFSKLFVVWEEEHSVSSQCAPPELPTAAQQKMRGQEHSDSSQCAPPELPTAAQQKMRGLDLSKQNVSIQDDFVHENSNGEDTVFGTGSKAFSKLFVMGEGGNNIKDAYPVENSVRCGCMPSMMGWGLRRR